MQKVLRITDDAFKLFNIYIINKLREQLQLFNEEKAILLKFYKIIYKRRNHRKEGKIMLY